mmetsp:Transcript_15586/g.40166  ORF Transcript_15586/g.40166 Transcript_15586/m.40166 type:complete len:267 (-) Transcript_15586:129-929(-)
MRKKALPRFSASPTLFSSSACRRRPRSIVASATRTRSAYSALASGVVRSTDLDTMVSTARVRTGSRITACLHTGHSKRFCSSHVSTHAQQNVWEHSMVAACTSQSWQMLQTSSEERSVTFSDDLLACRLRSASVRSTSSSLCSSAILCLWSPRMSSSTGLASGGGTSADGASKMNSNSGGTIFLPMVMTSPQRSLCPSPSLPMGTPFTRMPFSDLLSLMTQASGWPSSRIRSTRAWVLEIICGARCESRTTLHVGSRPKVTSSLWR